MGRNHTQGCDPWEGAEGGFPWEQRTAAARRGFLVLPGSESHLDDRRRQRALYALPNPLFDRSATGTSDSDFSDHHAVNPTEIGYLPDTGRR